MRVALRYQVPSPEAALIAGILKSHSEWKVTDVGEPCPDELAGKSFDMTVAVGPVTSIPLASYNVLFVFGHLRKHPAKNIDLAVVTNRKMWGDAKLYFGHSTRVVMLPPALVGLQAGKNNVLISSSNSLIHTGSLVGSEISVMRKVAIDLGMNLNCMSLWGASMDFPPFSVREFNALVRQGSVGLYLSPEVSDVQIRRHFALGGQVICPRDDCALGRLARHCIWDDNIDEIKKMLGGNNQQPVDAVEGDGVRYAEGVMAAIQLC